MKTTDIKIRIKAIREEYQKLEKEVETLQAACPHPRFEKGLSMIGCVQPVLLCTACGCTKAIDG